MKELTLLYVHGESIGYGRYGVELERHLRRIGIDVYDRIEEEDAPGDVWAGWESGPRRHKKTNAVCWVSTPGHARGWWDGQHVAISTMWEATKLPESFRENLHNFRTVIVPSDQNVELFSQFHPDVRKVQLGVDLERWHYQERQTPTTEFRFLIGGSGKRKGTDLAVRAFRKVFPDGSWGADDPVPLLILKSPKPEEYYGGRIRRVPGRISAEEEVGLYARAHCYLQPSRGEGFGLQPLQAIAQGIPTILTDAHGHKDFAHLGMRLSTTMEKAAYFIYGDAGEWWLPDFDELCDHMRYTYDNYASVARGAAVSAEIAAAQWGWEHTARQFVDVMGDELDKPYSGNGSWVVPDYKLYRVRVTKPWKADIADRVMLFEPGVDYYEPADVKRIMWEADLLDPECLDEVDTGLTDSQVAKLGAWRAEKAWCPTCGQQLGSGVRRSDVLFADAEAEARFNVKPRVTVASMFRDSTPYIARYFEQVAALRALVDVRLVLAEGDSTDASYALAESLLAEGDELYKIEHGGPRFASVDNDQRWAQIASVIRGLYAKVGDPGDAFIYVESDLVWEPQALARLVVDLEEVPAAAPMLMSSNHTRFYDIWGYRKDGTRFGADPPYHAGLHGQLVPIDSCGNCFACRPEVFKRLAEEWNGYWPARPEGLHVDTEVEVVHP